MGVPTSEVGYTAAMFRREDHEVHKDMWWYWTQNIYIHIYIKEHNNADKGRSSEKLQKGGY